MNIVLIAAAAAAAVIFIVLLCDMRLKPVYYTVRTDKLRGRVRLCLISDLHNCRYGKNEEKLISLVRENSPDIILLAGDIADDKHVNSNAVTLISALSRQYPCYMAMGNHEFRCESADDIRGALSRAGARILSGAFADCRGIRIFGVDDPENGEDGFGEQLRSCSDNKKGFSVLISHRPSRYTAYARCGFDLAVCGHMHGGQWRFPGINGLFVPREGLFPKYAGGIYRGKTTMVVSRGLARETTPVPRILNRPELVFIDIAGSTELGD